MVNNRLEKLKKHLEKYANHISRNPTGQEDNCTVIKGIRKIGKTLFVKSLEDAFKKSQACTVYFYDATSNDDLTNIFKKFTTDLEELSKDSNHSVCIIVDHVNTLEKLKNILGKLNKWKKNHNYIDLHTIIVSLNKPPKDPANYKCVKICCFKNQEEACLVFSGMPNEIINKLHNKYRGHQGFIYMALDGQGNTGSPLSPDQLPQKVEEIFNEAAGDLSAFLSEVSSPLRLQRQFGLFYLFVFFLFFEKEICTQGIKYDLLSDIFFTKISMLLNRENSNNTPYQTEEVETLSFFKDVFKVIVRFLQEESEELCKYNQAENDVEYITLYPPLIEWLLEEKACLFELPQSMSQYYFSPQLKKDEVWNQFKRCQSEFNDILP